MPGDYTLMQLGPVTLTGFEIPRTITLGGEQQLIVNKFVGKNKREVHLLGAQPRPIEWAGAFIYETAIPRARFFDGLRVKGDPLAFLWGEFSYIVVIQKFFFDPSNIYHVPYEITLEVVQDKTEPQNALVPSRDTLPDGIRLSLGFLRDLLGKLRGYLNVVRNLQASIRREINNIIGLGQHVMQEITDVVNLIYIQPTNLIAGLQADALSLSNQATNLVDQLGILTLSGNQLESGQSAATGADPMLDLIEVASVTKQLHDLLNRLRQPPFVVTTTVMNDNLFAVASRYYGGDVSAWEAIADFNGLTDTKINGPIQLKLPPINGVLPSPDRAAATPSTIYEPNVYPIPAAEGRNG